MTDDADRPVKVRSSSDKQRRSLKMAFGRAVDSLGGNLVVLGITRVLGAALSSYRATDDERDRHAGVDVCFDLDKTHADSGMEPPILTAYAGLLGYVIKRCEEVRSATALSLADAARLDRDAFEARSVLYEALADGRITPAEKRDALKYLDDLMHAISAIRAKVEAA